MFGAGIMPLVWWLGWCCFVGLLVGLCGLLLVGCCYVFLLLAMVGHSVNGLRFSLAILGGLMSDMLVWFTLFCVFGLMR